MVDMTPIFKAFSLGNLTMHADRHSRQRNETALTEVCQNETLQLLLVAASSHHNILCPVSCSIECGDYNV